MPQQTKPKDHWFIRGMNHALLLFVGILIVFSATSANSQSGKESATIAYSSSFVGAAGFDVAGWDVAFVGDVNKDGYEDLLIGAPKNNEGGLHAGAVYLIFGSNTMPSLLTPLTQSDVIFVGAKSSDEAGMKVAGIGDVNGDGFSDFFISAPMENNGTGKVYLIFGKSSGWSAEVRLSDADVIFAGEKWNDKAGLAIASAGDINRDGLPDILIGAPHHDNGSNDVGKVYLIFGKSTGWMKNTNLAHADVSFQGEAALDRLGFAVAGVGDINNDGIDDIAIGAPNFDYDRKNNVGKVYLFFGKNGVWNSNINVSNADASFIGAKPYDLLGKHISNRGDINGDGINDFLITAATMNTAGKIYIIFGKISDWFQNEIPEKGAPFFIGEKLNDCAGDPTLLDDLNADGTSDLLIAAPKHNGTYDQRGKVYVVMGKSDDWSQNVSLAVEYVMITGENGHDYAGHGIASGDFDGDGFPEIAIGAPGNDTNGQGAGIVYFYHSPFKPTMDFLTVTSPDGGEDWLAGSEQHITWTSRGEIENVTLTYSIDSGASWNTVIENTANDGDHLWIVQNHPSSTCLIRVEDARDSDPYDISDNVFTISTPISDSVWVISPNGGECFLAGTEQWIRWNFQGDVEYVKIKYSKDGGKSWIVVINSTPNDGTHLWKIPDIQSDSCLVRLADLDGDPKDVSDSLFTIGGKATITVKSPNGGECLKAGQEFEIKWKASSCLDSLKIQYSIDGGKDWTTIVYGTENDGYYTWTVPGVHSNYCLIKVADLDCDPEDTSDSVFTIWGKAPVTVISPNGGECLKPGQKCKIKWQACCCLDSLKIQYSTDGGQDWNMIVYGTENDGYYCWTVPDVHSDNCLIKVADLDCDPEDISDAPFTIWGKAPITIISPNGGECLQSGQDFEIKWEASCYLDSLKLQFSGDGGNDWTTIVYGTENDGSYLWTVPEINSDSCLIKVADLDCDPEDISDSLFTICAPPFVIVLQPNGGDTLIAGQQYEITWYACCFIDTVKIQYSINNGETWQNVIYRTENDGSYPWTVPDIASDSCLVKVADTDCDPFDVSDSLFTIVSAPMAVFDALIMSGSEPLEVQFINLTNRNATAWLWNFGDGGFSDEKNPAYTYDTPGKYTVKLKAYYPTGVDSVIKIDFIHVHEKETFAQLDVVNSTPTLPQYDWTNAIDGDIYGWDGTTVLEGDKPALIFSMTDSSQKEVKSIGLITDTGIGYEDRWIRHFQIQVSNTGIETSDFQTVLDTTMLSGSLEVFSIQPVQAKYVKLVILPPQTGLVHLGEFEVYYSDATTSTDSNIATIPQEFRLSQNYPNPFNPSTAIRFELPKSSRVKLEIYNILGEKIRTLFTGKKDAGRYEMTWDGKNKAGAIMPSGVYMCILSTGFHREVIKMVLAK